MESPKKVRKIDALALKIFEEKIDIELTSDLHRKIYYNWNIFSVVMVVLKDLTYGCSLVVAKYLFFMLGFYEGIV